MKKAALLLLLTLISSCVHTPTGNISPGLDRPPGAIFSSAPFYEEATQLDQLLNSNPSKAELESIQKNCSHESKNPFCPSIKIYRKLKNVQESKSTVRTAITVKPILPVLPEWKKTTVVNWKTLRKANVQSLIKGLLSEDPSQINTLSLLALKENHCPNNISVAIAATLEDVISKDAELVRISSLYQKGARCASREPIDKEHYLTRAGLLLVLANRMKDAAELFSKVRPMDAYSGRATYWLAKTREAIGDTAGSEKAYQRLVEQQPFSFHALLIQKSKGVDPGLAFLEKRDVIKSRTEKDQRLNQYIYQVELLNSHHYENSAAVLVDWLLSLRGIDPPVRLYIASLGDARARIITGSEFLLRKSKYLTQQTMELIYPKVYYPLFERNASSMVSPFLGLSVARKESVFNQNAVSVANAQGLLQLNPETSARLTNGRAHNLFDPGTNIELGMRYLQELMTHFSGDSIAVLASYNAGEEVVMNWKKRYGSIEPVLWMDLIPYRETRDYVGFVLANYFWYRRLYDTSGEIPSLF